MIVHFFEVWLALLVSFALGCAIGALAFEFAGQSRLGPLQRRIAHRVGVVVGSTRARLGLDAGWREYRYLPEQVTPFGEHSFQQESDNAPPATSDERPAPRPAVKAQVTSPPAPSDDAPDDKFPEDETAWRPQTDAKRPAGLSTPRKGVPDNLQRIRGIGRKNEVLLNDLGVFHFGQIAAWTPAEIAWIGQQIAFPERIERDDWVGQAVTLASGGDTGVTKAAGRRRARRNELFHNDADDDTGIGDVDHYPHESDDPEDDDYLDDHRDGDDDPDDETY
ncbi:MAG: hypothetical protein ACTSYE_03255 [Alphaproteobacteria bacterium]